MHARVHAVSAGERRLPPMNPPTFESDGCNGRSKYDERRRLDGNGCAMSVLATVVGGPASSIGECDELPAFGIRLISPTAGDHFEASRRLFKAHNCRTTLAGSAAEFMPVS
jgi:hypothetical protein